MADTIDAGEDMLGKGSVIARQAFRLSRSPNERSGLAVASRLTAFWRPMREACPLPSAKIIWRWAGHSRLTALRTQITSCRSRAGSGCVPVSCRAKPWMWSNDGRAAVANASRSPGRRRGNDQGCVGIVRHPRPSAWDGLCNRFRQPRDTTIHAHQDSRWPRV
jgi:hypothetical protein